MAFSVVMPALEMAQETGKLISWLKKEGESVRKGEPLFEIETDKAVMEIESPSDGILAGVTAAEGAQVPVGQTIAWIVRPGESCPANEIPEVSGRKTVATPPAISAQSHTSGAGTPPTSVRISPKARRLAAEHGVNLAIIHGSGPGGEILASDILSAANDATRSDSAKGTNAISRLMAERTTKSWTTIPHFFVTREVDAGALSGARRELSEAIWRSHEIKLTHSDLLVALVARTLVKHPRLNASWTGSGVRENSDVNIGLAIAVEEGVVAPVIRNAEKIGLADIAARRRDLTERAHSGKLQPSDLEGGTFTISNLGMFGVDAFTAIIVAPQAAILAVGAIADRVVPVDGLPVVRPVVTLTLSSDHRVVDGKQAAEFVKSLAEALGNPNQCLA